MSNGIPVLLLILDGWGQATPSPGNAITLARTPHFERLKKTFPHTTLQASGLAVGLPEGQMGNSEVGHLNLGAGRVVYQDLARISKAIADGSFFENPVLLDAIGHAQRTGTALHLLGLVSDGGVHSLHTHLYALLELARRKGLTKVFVHAFLDGRDTSPTSGRQHLEALASEFHRLGVGALATVCGRYFAMDRDKRWERVEKAYRLLTDPDRTEQARFENGADYLTTCYAEGTTDEFVPPARAAFTDDGSGLLGDGDAVIFFNFRADRARELTAALTDEPFTGFQRSRRPENLHYVCLTEYSQDFSLPTAFPSARLDDLLADVLLRHRIRNLRLAETEKYAHVTFFFNGGREAKSEVEDRILIPSAKVATYDLQPEMKAREVTAEALKALSSGTYPLCVVNLANPDMVGHTGNLEAAVQAVEVVDECLGLMIAKVLELDGLALVLADHGNAEQMLAEDGSPFTAHTCNPVPFILVDSRYHGPLAHDGALCDVAPTLLALLGLPQPDAMEGKDLRRPS